MRTVKAIYEGFTYNLRSVGALINFDRAVLDTATDNLHTLCAELDERNPHIAERIGRTLQALRTTRENDSMRRHYSTIYNQCIVLLVSHFGSTMHSMFTAAAPQRVGIAGKDSLKEELKFTLAELRELEFNLKESIGEVLTTKRDISFQDMQSTSKAFAGYLAVQVPDGEMMNNIILAQAARHVIVHSGARIDHKCLRQLRDATPRSVKPTLQIGEVLAFDPREVEAVASSMEAFAADVARKLEMDQS